jgi:flagellar biosynthesis/type III secretory pathway ATPase
MKTNTFKEYKTITDISGPLMLVEKVSGVTYGELVEITLVERRSLRRGQVLEIDRDKALVQLFESTIGMGTTGSKAKFLGKGIEFGLSPEILGRVFDGFGRPIDDGPAIYAGCDAGCERPGDQPLGARASARLHPDRDFVHRLPLHPGARPETADFFRLRLPPHADCGADYAAGPRDEPGPNSLW